MIVAARIMLTLLLFYIAVAEVTNWISACVLRAQNPCPTLAAMLAAQWRFVAGLRLW